MENLTGERKHKHRKSSIYKYDIKYHSNFEKRRIQMPDTGDELEIKGSAT